MLALYTLFENQKSKNGYIFLASSGGLECVKNLQKLTNGKGQYHISLWDLDFSKKSTKQNIKDFSTIGQTNKLFFNSKKQQVESIEILKSSKLKSLIVHGGNTKTIINNIYKFKLKEYLINIAKTKIYIGISAGVDVALQLKLIPNLQIYVHWDIYEKSKKYYQDNIFQNSPNDKRQKIDEYINESKHDIYLVFDDSYFLFVNNEMKIYGKMYTRQNNKWYQYLNQKKTSINNPL